MAQKHEKCLLNIILFCLPFFMLLFLYVSHIYTQTFSSICIITTKPFYCASVYWVPSLKRNLIGERQKHYTATRYLSEKLLHAVNLIIFLSTDIHRNGNFYSNFFLSICLSFHFGICDKSIVVIHPQIFLRFLRTAIKTKLI